MSEKFSKVGERSNEIVRYKYRAYPDAEQRDVMDFVFDCAAAVFNDFLHANGFGVFGPRLPYRNAWTMQQPLVTWAKKTPEGAWLAAAPVSALRQAIVDADFACQRFMKSFQQPHPRMIVHQPRFKDSGPGRRSFRLMRAEFHILDSTPGWRTLRLPKSLGTLRLRWSRDLPSAPLSVTILKEPNGQYFASFTVRRSTITLPPTARWAAIDLGLTSFATIVYSDGSREKIPGPKFLKTALPKIRAAEKRRRRCEPGSKNSEALRQRIAHLHRQVADSRADVHHKLSHRLAQENQRIIFESLDTVGLAQKGIGDAIYDAGWATFINITTDKAKRFGRDIVLIDRFEPTSQTCAPCGHRDGPKPLDVREWTCPECGARLDRDYNAAVNIAVAGDARRR